MGHRQAEQGESRTSVRGLPLPGLLTDLLAAGRWRHPGDDVVREVIPWFESPLVFLTSVGQLPWLDVGLAFFVAVNRVPGDDVAIALDYRSDQSDPRVVASDFWTQPGQCAWRIVAPALSAFADALGLLDERPVAGFPAGEADGKVM